jgi:hypothetical protein
MYADFHLPNTPNRLKLQAHCSSSLVVHLAGYYPSNSGLLSVHHWDVPDLFLVCGSCAMRFTVCTWQTLCFQTDGIGQLAWRSPGSAALDRVDADRVTALRSNFCPVSDVTKPRHGTPACRRTLTSSQARVLVRDTRLSFCEPRFRADPYVAIKNNRATEGMELGGWV